MGLIATSFHAAVPSAGNAPCRRHVVNLETQPVMVVAAQGLAPRTGRRSHPVRAPHTDSRRQVGPISPENRPPILTERHGTTSPGAFPFPRANRAGYVNSASMSGFLRWPTNEPLEAERLGAEAMRPTVIAPRTPNLPLTSRRSAGCAHFLRKESCRRRLRNNSLNPFNL